MDEAAAAPVRLLSSTMSSIFYRPLAAGNVTAGGPAEFLQRRLATGETAAIAVGVQLGALLHDDGPTLTATEMPTTVAVEMVGNLEEQICGEYENYTLLRFLFLSMSSLIALFGAGANLVLFALFSLRKCENTPPTLYPRVLALLDAIICTVYILLFGADAAVFYLHIESLFVLYHIYIVPAFVISRIAQIAIPYMLIFATLERFVWIAGNMRNQVLKRMYSVRGRYVTVATSLLICAALRLPTAWATRVYEYPRCDDFFRSKIAAAAPWVHDNLVYHVYDFHLLSIAQTVLPFFVLLAFNVVTVRRLSKMRVGSPPPPPAAVGTGNRPVGMSESPSIALDSSNDQLSRLASLSSQNVLSASPSQPCLVVGRNLSADSTALMRKPSTSQRMNSPVKCAITTMVCIVASYLISNSLHLILTVLERSNSDLLKHPTDPNLASTFHTTFSDMVSFIYMFTSAIRIAIYYACNPTIREDVDEWAQRAGDALARRRRRHCVAKADEMIVT